MIELFSCFDQAASRFMDPFPAPTVEFALRGFREACETEGHQMQKYPEDYVLYQVGTFDPETGFITAFDARKIAMATSYANIITAQPLQIDLIDQLEEQA